MRIYRLETGLLLARARDEVFPFFADAFALEQLSPPFLRFAVLTPAPIVLERGRCIDYRLTVHGWPVRWRSEISVWEPPALFVDEQRRGPYRLWIHRHVFEERGRNTWAADEVDYAPPGGPLAGLVQALLVARDLRRIFRYRQQALARLFGQVGEARPVTIRPLRLAAQAL